MADVLIYAGVGVIILGVIALIVIAFTKGSDTARLGIMLPISLLFLITDKKGRWVWAGITLGIALLLIGLSI